MMVVTNVWIVYHEVVDCSYVPIVACFPLIKQP